MVEKPGHGLVEPGTRVKAVQPNHAQRHQWREDAWSARRWGEEGIIFKCVAEGNECVIRFSDGYIASYDPSEFDIIPADTS